MVAALQCGLGNISIVGRYIPDMSGLSYFTIEIQAWIFEMQSKSNHSPNDFENIKSKSKNQQNTAF